LDELFCCERKSICVRKSVSNGRLMCNVEKLACMLLAVCQNACESVCARCELCMYKCSRLSE
jgi:hypothetical protein